MFYDRYVLLCENIGKKPYTVAKELGLGNSNVAQWKKGSTPRSQVIQLMSDYFGVPISFLLVGDEKKPSVQMGGGLEENTKYAQLNDENRAMVDSLIEKLLIAQLSD